MNIISLSVAAEQFEDARSQIRAIAETCSNIIVSDEQSLATATELAKNAGKISKYIEDKRKEITAPILSRKKEIDNYAKDLAAELNKAVRGLRAQILSYKQEQERIRQEEIRRLEAERQRKEAELRAKLEAEKEITHDEVEEFREIKQQEAEIQAAPKPKGIRKTWEWELEDISKVPLEYLTVNQAIVKKAIAGGMREIPGIRIYQKEHLVLR